MGGIGTNVGSGGEAVGDGGTGVHVDVGPKFIAVRVAVERGAGREPVDEQAVKYMAVKSNHSHLAFVVRTCSIPPVIFHSRCGFFVPLR